jgi:hypothetical protein
MPEDEIAAVDKWRGKQPDQPTRPIAIRQLIKRGLKPTA